MRYLLIALFLWAGNISAQAIVVHTTDVLIVNESCDSTVLFLELDCTVTVVGNVIPFPSLRVITFPTTVTVVGNVMTLREGKGITEIIKVWYVESSLEDEGILRIYEHYTGYVYINTEVPYVIIEDEAGCVHYFNQQ